MLLRPADTSGDLLPVPFSSALLSGPEAVARLAEYRLSLLRGDWWENPETGFQILEALSSSRLTEADAQTLSSMISAVQKPGKAREPLRGLRFQEDSFRIAVL